MSTRAQPAPRSDERAWLLRAVLVLQSPVTVFAALRDDSEEAARARAEPIIALVWLAGIAGVLGTSAASTVLDDPARDGLIVAVWAFIGGGFYGIALYFAAGALLHWALQRVGAPGSYRRARHLLAFAAAPVALSLLLYWPVRIALYGGDLFRSGGPDGRGAGDALAWGFYVFVAWAVVLLVVGIRAVHGWSWGRTLGAAGVAVVLGAVVVAVVGSLYALSR